MPHLDNKGRRGGQNFTKMRKYQNEKLWKLCPISYRYLYNYLNLKYFCDRQKCPTMGHF